MRIRNILILSLAAFSLVSAAGCSALRSNVVEPRPILGAWYDSRTGAEYRFLSGGVLVVPTSQPGDGNAVTYKLLGNDGLDITAGGVHRVSLISTVTAEQLVLTDPGTGQSQPLLRDPAATRFASNLARGAIAHLGDAASASTDASITWVARKPSGKGAEWTRWPTSSIDTFLQSWDWTGLKRADGPIAAAGSGRMMGYSFTLHRTVSSEATLAANWTNDSIEPTAGLPLIDVGYSETKAEYPQGALVYLSRGLIFSLGDGYAVAIVRDERSKAFVPLTHR